MSEIRGSRTVAAGPKATIDIPHVPLPLPILDFYHFRQQSATDMHCTCLVV